MAIEVTESKFCSKLLQLPKSIQMSWVENDKFLFVSRFVFPFFRDLQYQLMLCEGQWTS